MVVQSEKFLTYTNERLSNILWRGHQIYKWKHQKYWSNFEKLHKKPGISKYWQSIENKFRSYQTLAATTEIQKVQLSKNKTQPIKVRASAITQTNFKKSYANVVAGNTNVIDPKVQNLRKTKKASIQEEPPTLLKKLELLHPAHTQHHRWKSPTRVPSNTKQTSTNRDNETEDLKNQFKLLKQNQKQRDTQEQPKHTENKEQLPSQKTCRWPPPQEAILKQTSIW